LENKKDTSPDDLYMKLLVFRELLYVDNFNKKILNFELATKQISIMTL
jgi:hypothetical protein